MPKITNLAVRGPVVECKIGDAWQYYALGPEGEARPSDGAGNPCNGILLPPKLRRMLSETLKRKDTHD